MTTNAAVTVGSGSTRLITLRGSSGSGKSTVAAAIRSLRPEGSVAILGQDVIRRQMLGTGDDRDGHAIAVIDAMARLLLDRGFDVIIEGILNAVLYTEPLVRLVGDHRGVSRSYIWDLPFEETVRRHATKPVATEFGEAELRRWWRGFNLLRVWLNLSSARLMILSPQPPGSRSTVGEPKQTGRARESPDAARWTIGCVQRSS